MAARPIVHLRGLPWEVDADAVRAALQPLLEAPPSESACHVEISDVFLPCDAKARPSGAAFLQLSDGADAQRAADRLQGRHVGARYLEARVSGGAELRRAREQSDAHRRGVAELAAQPWFGRARAERPPIPTDRRDIVVFCHCTAPSAIAGDFALDDLAVGRVDLWARCVSAAIFCSHAVRKGVRVHLLLRPDAPDAPVTAVCCDGGAVRGLRPDERTIATALRRALRGEGEGSGWSVRSLDGAARVLRELVEPSAGGVRRPLIALHEEGAQLGDALSALPQSAGEGWVVACGDHLGFTEAEEVTLDALGATRASLGAVPLLASHCIVIAHHFLDDRWLRGAGA